MRAHVERIAQRVAQQVEDGDRHEKRQPWHEDGPRGELECRALLAHHGAPLVGRPPGAQTQKRHAGHGEHRIAYGKRCHHHERRGHVRKEVLATDGRQTGTAHSGRFHAVGFFERQRQAAREARELGPLHRHNGDDHVHDALAEYRRDGDCQDKTRKRLEHGDELVEGRVDRPSRKPCDKADDNADDERYGDDCEGHEHRFAPAEKGPKSHVAANRIAAQQKAVRPGGAVRMRQIGRIWIERHDEGHERQDPREHRRDNRPDDEPCFLTRLPHQSAPFPMRGSMSRCSKPTAQFTTKYTMAMSNA